MRVRITPRLLVRVVSGKRNYEHQSGGDGDGDGDGDGIIRGRKNMNGWVLWINNTLFCSSRSTKAAEEEEEVEVASSSSGRKINMFKEVVSHGLRRIFVPHGKSKKIALGKQKLGRSFKCLVSRFSGMFRLKKKKKKGGFRLRKWKKKIRMRKSSSVGAMKKRFARIRSCRIRKEEEIELCKKRILMGEKCKPLNVSGSLHYDQNGVLLPEPLLLPFPCES